MAASLRRSASAPAAMETNSLPRWLISITDMPASCQLTSSHLAFSSTSTGMVAGPAPKLKIRAAGLMRAAEALAFGAAAFAAFLRGFAAVLVRAVAVRVFAILVIAVEDALQARELLPLAQVDQGDALRRPAHLADLVHPRADEHAARGDEHDLVLRRHQRRGHHAAIALRRLDRNHALGAAAVARVLHDRGALAVPVLGGREHALLLVL